MTRWIVLAALAACAHPVLAEHPPEHMALHERFYSTWMQPDHPQISCCHNEDCRPAQSRQAADGHWQARWTDDMPWVTIPPEKVDQVRETPDGLAHMCGRYYATPPAGFYVFCFVRGGGV